MPASLPTAVPWPGLEFAYEHEISSTMFRLLGRPTVLLRMTMRKRMLGRRMMAVRSRRRRRRRRRRQELKCDDVTVDDDDGARIKTMMTMLVL